MKRSRRQFEEDSDTDTDLVPKQLDTSKDIREMNVKELRVEYKKRGISYGKLTKSEMITKLLNQINNERVIENSDSEEEIENKIKPSNNLVRSVEKVKKQVGKLENVIGIDFGATHIVIVEIQDDKPEIILNPYQSHSNSIETKFYIEKDGNVEFCTQTKPPKGYDLILKIKQKIGFGLTNFSDLKESNIIPNLSEGNKLAILSGSKYKVLEPKEIYQRMMEKVLRLLFEHGKFDKNTIFLLSIPNQYSVRQSQFTYPNLFKDAAKKVLKNWKENVKVYNESSSAINYFIMIKKKYHENQLNLFLIDIGDSSINLSSAIMEYDSKSDQNKIKYYHSGTILIGGHTFTEMIYKFILDKIKLDFPIQKQEKLIIEANIEKYKPELCNPKYKHPIPINNLFEGVSIDEINSDLTINSKKIIELSQELFKKIENLIKEHFKTFELKIPQNIIYCGGGMNNKSLTQFLKDGIFKGKKIDSSNPTEIVAKGLFYRYALEETKNDKIIAIDYPPFSIYTLLYDEENNNERKLYKLLGKNECEFNTNVFLLHLEKNTYFPLIQVDSIDKVISETEFPNLEIIYFGCVNFSSVKGKNLPIQFCTSWKDSKLLFQMFHKKVKHEGTHNMVSVKEKKLLLKDFDFDK